MPSDGEEAQRRARAEARAGWPVRVMRLAEEGDLVPRPLGDGEEVPPAVAAWIEAGYTAVTHYRPLCHAGDLSLLQRPCLAIVGTRDPSPLGIKRAARLAREAVAAGVVVMSGLALGIDHAAHVATIEAGGQTIAVIGTPLTRSYPFEHRALQRHIADKHLLISPFTPHMQRRRSNFVERNHVIAELAHACAIIEASDDTPRRNSGSLYAPRRMLTLGKPVYFPQSLLTHCGLQWPSLLLAGGATPFSEPSAVLDTLRRA